MPYTRFRSSSAKKHVRRTPSGKRSVIHRKATSSPAICAICSARLGGVPRGNPARLSKTEKRPERMFGGVLCSNCVVLIVKEKTRLETGALSREEVPLNHLKYIDTVKF